MTHTAATETPTLDPHEIEKFARDSARWWDETGPFAPLHRLNPTRLGYLRGQIVGHFGLDACSLKPFTTPQNPTSSSRPQGRDPSPTIEAAEGAGDGYRTDVRHDKEEDGQLTILDIGCGGGLVCEPLARLGAQVTGIDADANAIAAAKAHAEAGGLSINYRTGTSDSLQEQFDVVLALEIVEHVADVPAFIADLKRLVRPGGLVILSTLNRTRRSYLGAIIAAEYMLRWVPRGTHQWKRFLKPSELARELRQAGLTTSDLTGMVYNPVSREFALSKTNLAVNYFVIAVCT
jgi:2-polyprenyl-6-hydroxyphenyl methylase/3-demethylubiquinone-9 3-methyltransferase